MEQSFSLEQARATMLAEPFFMRPTQSVARELLGCVLVRQVATKQGMAILAGRIVETEAYLHEHDAASHSCCGRTPRNAAMFGPAGTLYVYKSYGIHHCVNIVTEQEGRGCAVLLRAVEPWAGVEIMQQNRGVQDKRLLCRGPGNLARAFGFTLSDNGISCCSAMLFCCRLYGSEVQKNSAYHTKSTILATPRIGITRAAHLPLRFIIADSDFLSKFSHRRRLAP
jgi:DNA-3-methyladenine glycosylase